MLDEVEGIEVRDLGTEKSGIVSFEMAGAASADVVAALRRQGINIHSTTVTSTRHDMEGRGITEMNRAGVHYYNTDGELEQLVAALSALLREA